MYAYVFDLGLATDKYVNERIIDKFRHYGWVRMPDDGNWPECFLLKRTDVHCIIDHMGLGCIKVDRRLDEAELDAVMLMLERFKKATYTCRICVREYVAVRLDRTPLMGGIPVISRRLGGLVRESCEDLSERVISRDVSFSSAKRIAIHRARIERFKDSPLLLPKDLCAEELDALLTHAERCLDGIFLWSDWMSRTADRFLMFTVSISTIIALLGVNWNETGCGERVVIGVLCVSSVVAFAISATRKP